MIDPKELIGQNVLQVIDLSKKSYHMMLIN
jgi:hypothetical protein